MFSLVDGFVKYDAKSILIAIQDFDFLKRTVVCKIEGPNEVFL